ncbi:hypothetical protein G6L15_06630 [Agrobacterium rhizogenes]|uniref:hypothetical protein n=1 Tax=Rhizobium rhizogenes TaxID=359 RepID=UPI001571C7ED|nr:hypothetical protein [Rhizobium rhizogenes]NTG85824.1 hypothetical protein [Rhizobium rhizogenes]
MNIPTRPNIFNKIVADEYGNDTKLGMPATDIGHYQRRLDLMSRITGGRGFRVPTKEPATRGTTGKTRGQLKREARERANANVSEYRDRRFMHASARRTDYVTLKVAA